MSFTRWVFSAALIAAAAFGCGRDSSPVVDRDRDGTIETPAGHTTHETGAQEFTQQGRRGTPTRRTPTQSGPPADANTVAPETTPSDGGTTD